MKIIWLLFILVLTSCQTQEASNTYYFAWYYEEGEIPSYRQIVIEDKGNKRTEKISDYDQDLQLKDKDLNRFLIGPYGLEKQLGDEHYPFLSIANNDCIEFNLGDQQANELFGTVICFLGKEDVFVGASKVVKDAYKFRKLLGYPGGVESVMYLDKNFVLLKEEYVSGYTEAYEVVRLDSAFSL